MQALGGKGFISVKVPIVSPEGKSREVLIRKLSRSGIDVNVTAITTEGQALAAVRALEGRRGIISIFAGRVADLGFDPEVAMEWPLMEMELHVQGDGPSVLWGGAREVYNVMQAARSGCRIITLAPTLLTKMPACMEAQRGGKAMGAALRSASRAVVEQFAAAAKGMTF